MQLRLLQQLAEMTARSSPLDGSADQTLNQTLDWMDDNAEPTGYQDHKKILQYADNNTLTLSIVNDYKSTSFINGDFIEIFGKKYFQIRLMYSLPDYRMKGDIARLFWFVKHHLNHSIIFYGWQTPSTINMLNNLSKINRFEIIWLNTDTGEREKYSFASDKRTNFKINDWKIIIEQDDAKHKIERWADTIFKFCDTIIRENIE